MDQAFASLFERASDPAFVLAPLEDRFVAANVAGCALLGYAHEEMLETPISAIHPGELEQLQEFVGGVLRAGHGSTITLTCRTRSGQRLPAEMCLWAVEDQGERHVLGLVHDRSEHRQTNPETGRSVPMVTKGLDRPSRG